MVKKAYIVFLGAPGAGKGTQSQILTEKFGLPQLSTGNMLREAMAAQTDIGLKAKDLVNAGELVPDDIVIGIIAERIEEEDCVNGFILDGFPRNVAQAKSLDDVLFKRGLELTHVFNLEVNEEALVERRSGRLFAPKSGRTYHVKHNQPKVAGKCDVTGEKLITREDDTEEVLRHRLRVYEEQTAPVKEFYAARDMVQEFDGGQPLDVVARQLEDALNA